MHLWVKSPNCWPTTLSEKISRIFSAKWSQNAKIQFLFRKHFATTEFQQFSTSFLKKAFTWKVSKMNVEGLCQRYNNDWGKCFLCLYFFRNWMKNSKFPRKTSDQSNSDKFLYFEWSSEQNVEILVFVIYKSPLLLREVHMIDRTMVIAFLGRRESENSCKGWQ